MATDFERQRLAFRSHKTLITAGLLLALFAIHILAGTAMGGGYDERPNRPRLAPLINENSPNRIPDQYIVIFKPGTKHDVVLAAQNRVKGLRSTIRTTYTSGLIGFSAELSENVLQDLRTNPSVDYIEVNQTGWFNTVQCNNIPSICLCGPNPPYLPCYPVSAPPTGLDRTSARHLTKG